MSSLQDAQQALASGDLEEAQAIAAGLLKTDPNSAEAWYILSQAVGGDRQEIFKNKALLLDPDIESKMASAEPDFVDELFDFNSPDFPDLDGPDDSMLAAEMEDDVEDELEVDPVMASNFSDNSASDSSTELSETDSASTSGVESDATDSSSEIPVISGQKSAIDFNFISLVGVGLAMLVVLGLLLQSLFF